MGKQKQSNFFLYFGLAWLVLAAPFVLAGRLEILSERRFEAHGVKTQGKLTDKKMETRRDRDRETNRITETKSFYAHYTFVTNEGSALESHDSVSEEIWNGLVIGGPVEIQYIPNEAHMSRISRDSSIVGGVLMCCLGGLGMLVGAVSVFFNLRERFGRSKLLTTGVLADATITSVGHGTLILGGVPQWRIQYSYTDLTGQSRTGKTGHLSPEEAQRWKRGDKVKVRFNPANPSKSILIDSE